MEQGLWQVNAAIGKDCTDNLDEKDHDAGDEDFVQSARGVVREWLKNIKRYAELRAGWGRRLLKWVLDRFILRLKVSQRRVILMLLAWEGIGCVTFLMLAIAWGVAKLLGLM